MIDYKKAFKGTPAALVVLAPDYPYFTILAANDRYLSITGAKEEEILGKPLFKAFDDNSPESESINTVLIKEHLRNVLDSQRTQLSAIVKYSVKIENVYEDKFWSIDHTPILENGKVLYIIQNATDLTNLISKGLSISKI